MPWQINQTGKKQDNLFLILWEEESGCRQLLRKCPLFEECFFAFLGRLILHATLGPRINRLNCAVGVISYFSNFNTALIIGSARK
jgi:hypothetical protein